MASLNIRNLPDEVHASLRVRAARAGRSMEAEARAILADACAPPRPLIDGAGLRQFVRELYGGQTPTGVVDDLLAARRSEASAE